MSERVFQHKTCGGVAYTVDGEECFVLGYGRYASRGGVQFPYGGAIACATCHDALLMCMPSRPNGDFHVDVYEVTNGLRAAALLARHYSHRNVSQEACSA